LDNWIKRPAKRSQKPWPASAPDARTATPAAVPSVSAWAAEVLGFHADPLQKEVLDCPAKRVLLNACRQFGKSRMAAMRIAHHAIHYPNSNIVIASPGERQSGELYLKVKDLLAKLGVPTKSDGINEHSLVLPNGSRIVGLPHSPDTVRGFSGTDLLVIDEASYASTELYVAVMPFLATSNGTMWVMSTPKGQTGMFYELWHNERLAHWQRFRLTADQCPRIPTEFLEEMKIIHPARYWEEFMCEFRAAATQVFDREILTRCHDDAYEPFFGNGV